MKEERKKVGRPTISKETRRETKGIRLPAWLWAWIDEQTENRSQFIEDCIIKQGKINWIKAKAKKETLTQSDTTREPGATPGNPRRV